MKNSIKEWLNAANENNCAIGAFNIFNFLSIQAAIAAAEEVHTPIILQTSVGTVRQFTPETLLALVDLARKDASVPVILHLDHCTDTALLKRCVDLGWDSVMIDMSKKPFAENLAISREMAAYAHKHRVDIEAELGIISGVEEDVSSAVGKTTDFDEAMDFAARSGVDIFAPSIGTAHGVYKGPVHLDFALLERLNAACPLPLVVHGGTGLSDEDFTHLIQVGAAKINVSTALKHAYADALSGYLTAHPDEYNPIKLDNAAFAGVKACVAAHIRRFGTVAMAGKDT